ncbi:hypothetical protein N9W89_10535 [Hellea sp.]|nr:hypothetical protein [Hellea sp.]
MVFGVGTILKFDTYFTDFWRIRNCDPTPYTEGDFMWGCQGITVSRYDSGSIFLGVQKDAIKNAENADVVIFGNSRTKRSFSTNGIDDYFKSKGLTYVVLAAEGAGYKSALITMERFDLKPKIIMANYEIFYTDLISPNFRELVDFPEKYKTRFTFFYNAQRVQKFACQSNIKWLKDFYCSGKVGGRWRSARTASMKWNLVAPEEDQVLITPNPDYRIRAAGQMVTRAREFLEVKGYEDACPIMYLVNSPNTGTSAFEIGKEELGIQFVYKDVPGLYSYDKSHLDRPNSEKWAKEFVKALDPAIDTCLSGGGRYTPKVEIPFDINTADVAGVSDFETWLLRDGVTVSDSVSEAPDGTLTADTFTIEKAGVPIQKIYRETAIKAGTTVTFGGWFWSEDEMDIQLRLIKSCTRDTPMETFATNYNLSNKPKRMTVSYTFKEDHGCALIRMVGLQPGTSFNAWQARADYQMPTDETLQTEEDVETEE